MCGAHIERNSTDRCRRVGLEYQRAGGALLVRTHGDLLFLQYSKHYSPVADQSLSQRE